MEDLKPDERGFCKIRKGAAYGGVCKRTLRGWFGEGLVHYKLPSGTILTSYADIDRFLAQFRKGGSEVEQIADQIMDDL